MEQSIPDDWDGEYCTYGICWPDSPQWRIILRGLLSMPRQGRFWAASSGSILGVQAIARQTEDFNFELREAILACTDDQFAELIAAINAISITGGGTTIVNCYSTGSGEGGSRGAGEIEAPIVPYDPVETPGVPPEGFEDMEAFRLQKCRAAWAIVREMGADLQSLSAWSYAAQTLPAIAGALITVLLTPIGWAALITLIGLLAYTSFQYGFLSQASAIIYEFRAEIVCELSTSATALQAKTRLLAKIEELIDQETVWLQIEKNFVNSVVAFFVNNDSINRMFEAVPLAAGEDDCSGCPCDDTFSVKFNFLDSIVGWSLNPGVTFSEPNYNQQVGVWVLDWNEVGASLHMGLGAGVSNTKGTAYVAVSHTIRPSDAFYTRTIVGGGTMTFNWFLASPSGTVIVSGGFGTGGNATIAFDLVDYIGVEVGYIGLYVAKANSESYNVDYPYVWISCVAP